MQQRDYAGARADAEETIKNNPEDVRGPRILADTYLAQRQPERAEERLKEIVAEHPRSAPLANLLGIWYQNAKNLPAARKAFEAALAADPKFVDAALPLARIDYQEKHVDAARQRLLGVVAANPKNIPAQLMLASIAGDAGDQEEAVSRYRSVIALDSSNVTALNGLAYTLGSSDPDEAMKYPQQAAELAPDNATVEDTLGWVYYKKAIYGRAVTYLETAVAKQPTPRRQFHLAMCYLKSGQRDLGEKTLQLALRQDPICQYRRRDGSRSVAFSLQPSSTARSGSSLEESVNTRKKGPIVGGTNSANFGAGAGDAILWSTFPKLGTLRETAKSERQLVVKAVGKPSGNALS